VRGVRGLCDVVDIVNENKSGRKKAGDEERGGGKIENGSRNSSGVKRQIPQRCIGLHSTRIKEASLQVNLLCMMKVNPSCNSQLALSDQHSYFLRILAPV
jgi:hypothetical protein